MVAPHEQQPKGYFMLVSEIRRFLLDQLPLVHQSLIPTALKAAYTAAFDLAKDQPILQTPSAIDNRGRLIAWAVDLAFERLITTGQWPYEYSWQPFAKPTGRFLRVHLDHSTLTISQVERAQRPPRYAKFRENAFFNNTPFLFPEMEKERQVTGLPAFLLVHGHRSLDFAHLGLPHSTERHYLYRSPNLLSIPHVVAPEEPPAEAVDEEVIITLKDEIQRWQSDNDA